MNRLRTVRPVILICLVWTGLPGCGNGGSETPDAARDAATSAHRPAGDPEDTAAAAPGSERDRTSAGAPEPGTGFPAATSEDPRILIRDTNLRVTPSAILWVSELLGQLVRSQDAPAYFDEPSSYEIRVERAGTTMTGSSLAALMNEYVFAYEGAPLSDISIEIRDGRLHQEATLDAVMPVAITMVARLEVTGEGSLLLVPEEVKAAGIPVTSVMDLLGVEMDDVLGTLGSRGVTVVENDLLLDPEKLLPPPRFRGRAGSVSLEGDLLHLTLVRSGGEAISADGLQPPAPDAPHFIFFRGGEVRFGKLTMRDTDLQIADAEPSDPFDFHSGQFHRQLVAGVSRTMPDRGLLVEVPDFADMGR